MPPKNLYFTKALIFSFGLKLALVLIGNLLPHGWNGWEHIFDVLARNDSGWYHQIARDWYPTQPPSAGEQTAFPFFPLYPLFLSGFLKLTGHYIYGALILHVILTFIWIYVLFLYLRSKGFSDKQIFIFSVFYQCFPWAYFFHAFYSELLFSSLLLTALFAIESKKVSLLFFSTMLLALCRPTGLMMAAGMVFIIAEYGGWIKVFSNKLRFKQLLALSGALFGVFVWSIYLHYYCGDALAFSHGQAAWGRAYKWPWEAFFPSGMWDVQLLSVYVIILLVLSFFVLSKATKGEAIFTGINLLFPLITGAVTSYYRFFLVIPQIFEKAFALIEARWQIVSAVLLILNLVTFGYWVSYSGWLSF